MMLAMTAMAMLAQNNVAEEVAWVIGDEPIFKSDIEDQYQQALYERAAIDGNPYCVIPEKMALDKLFLDQARIDTVEVQQSTISAEVESRINFFIANLGSKEKVEEYFRMPIPRLREKLNEMYSDQYCIQQVQNDLTKNVKATPADVRKFFNTIPKDSLPFIPMQVETQIITINPLIPQQEIDEVKHDCVTMPSRSTVVNVSSPRWLSCTVRIRPRLSMVARRGSRAVRCSCPSMPTPLST